MKKFLINIGLFFLLLVSVLFGIFCTVERNEEHYFCMLEKKRNAFASIEGERILFLGDSNLAFGLNSKTISDSLNRPVVNAGLHGGIGLQYMLNEYEKLVRKGDVVVIAPVFDQYYNGAGEYLSLPVALFYNHWHGISKLSFEQWKVFFSGFMQIIKQRNLNLSNEASYRASYFNEYGDEIKHWSMPSLEKIPYMSYAKGAINKSMINSLYDIVQKWKRTGADVYIMPPACTIDFYKENKLKIEQLSSTLKQAELPFIISPERCIFDLTHMYDGNYHLSKKGVDAYTALMIETLQSQI